MILSSSPLPSERTPQLSPMWLAALKNVDYQTAKIWDHPNRVLFKGFALPDPYMLYVSQHTSRPDSTGHLIVWLLLRPGWVTHTTSRSSVCQSAMPQTSIGRLSWYKSVESWAWSNHLRRRHHHHQLEGLRATGVSPHKRTRGPPGKVQRVQKTRPAPNVDANGGDVSISTSPLELVDVLLGTVTSSKRGQCWKKGDLSLSPPLLFAKSFGTYMS